MAIYLLSRCRGQGADPPQSDQNRHDNRRVEALRSYGPRDVHHGIRDVEQDQQERELVADQPQIGLEPIRFGIPQVRAVEGVCEVRQG